MTTEASDAHVQRKRESSKHHRKRASTMLLLGAISGFFGFLFAFTIGVLRSSTVARSYAPISDSYCYRKFDGARLRPCYFPATVSELVHDSDDPAGKVFFFFEFTGAIMIFFSWYPSELRSVYIGDDATLPGRCISWVTFRQYVPAPGMMMLSVIRTVPMPQADLTDFFCIGLHLTGALLMFVGYFFAEGVAIGWGPFHRCVRDDKRRIDPKASMHRKIALTGVALFYVIFCVLQVALSVGSGDSFDQWDTVTDCHLLTKDDCQKPQLIRAADKPLKNLKELSYASEIICGLFVIGSHLLIWYHCEERHYDLHEELPSFIFSEGYEPVQETQQVQASSFTDPNEIRNVVDESSNNQQALNRPKDIEKQ